MSTPTTRSDCATDAISEQPHAGDLLREWRRGKDRALERCGRKSETQARAARRTSSQKILHASSSSGSALSASTRSRLAALSAGLRSFAIFAHGNNRHKAMHGRGTMASSSGSGPNTSQKPHSPGTPNFHKKGFRTSGLLSKGSQPIGLVLSAIVVVSAWLRRSDARFCLRCRAAAMRVELSSLALRIELAACRGTRKQPSSQGPRNGALATNLYPLASISIAATAFVSAATQCRLRCRRAPSPSNGA